MAEVRSLALRQRSRVRVETCSASGAILFERRSTGVAAKHLLYLLERRRIIRNLDFDKTSLGPEPLLEQLSWSLVGHRVFQDLRDEPARFATSRRCLLVQVSRRPLCSTAMPEVYEPHRRSYVGRSESRFRFESGSLRPPGLR